MRELKLLLPGRRARYRAIVSLYREHEMRTLHSIEEWIEFAKWLLERSKK